MAKGKKCSSNKHLDFIALLRSQMLIPEKEIRLAAVSVDNDAENEAVSQLQKELEAKFDTLFVTLN